MTSAKMRRHDRPHLKGRAMAMLMKGPHLNTTFGATSTLGHDESLWQRLQSG